MKKSGENKPGSAVAAAIAKELETTVDFLMNGSANDAATDAGLERELLARLRQVQDLPAEEMKTVPSLLDAFVAKSKIQVLLNS